MHTLAAPYALHALDENEERSFEQHLADCEHCRELVAAVVAGVTLDAALEQWRRHRVPDAAGPADAPLRARAGS